MKIAITKEAKRILTVAEMPSVCRLIKEMKEDDDLEYYAKLAAIVAAGSYDADVLRVSAEIAKNCRVRNAYHEESADLDVWVRFTAYTDKGFVMRWHMVSRMMCILSSRAFILSITKPYSGLVLVLIVSMPMKGKCFVMMRSLFTTNAKRQSNILLNYGENFSLKEKYTIECLQLNYRY